MAASHNLSQVSNSGKFPISKSGVLTLHGYGVRVTMQAGHLQIEDGVGLERRTFRLPRVGHKLNRLICISHDGYVTLSALSWLANIGASFVVLDRRGKAQFVTGPCASSDARLRRAQALALGNGTALKISRSLIEEKLAGQAELVRDMLNDRTMADAIQRLKDDLARAESISSIRLIESQGARLYWSAWSDVSIRWPRKDERKVPEHWKRFGSRISPLTGSPRLATNPANSILNLLYALCEIEARLACSALGLDPELGVLHVDSPSRSSLACDVQEVTRPKVDAFLLNWLRTEPFRRSDFWEDGNGNCRITTTLAKKLCQTSATWRDFTAPVAEYVAMELAASVAKSPTHARQLVATRLTQKRKRKVKGGEVPAVKEPNLEHVCRGCGKPLMKGRQDCGRCAVNSATQRLVNAARLGRIARQSPEARAKHSNSARRQADARSSWDSSSKPAWLTAEVFSQRIQPLLANVSPSAIRSRIGVSRMHASRIRKGYRPHPRHWLALAEMVGLSPG